MMTYDDRVITLINEATQWVGVREDEGENRGVAVDTFELAVSPRVVGLPWCLSFLQYCVRTVDKLALDGFKTSWPLTACCLELWNKTPQDLRIPNAKPGAAVVWRHYGKDGKALTTGHVGLITHLIDQYTVATIEGNTGPGAGVVSEGDGVYIRTRNIEKAQTGTMRVLGFLRVWPLEVGLPTA